MLIKRYPNRKLYNTQSKKYISLDELAGMIRLGEEIHVVDTASGEDLTDLTLTQILFEQVKKQAGFLPRTLLSGLIQAGGDRISSVQRLIAHSLGLSGQVNAEIHRRLENLVMRGEITQEEADLLEERLIQGDRVDLQPDELTKNLVEQVVADRGLATHKEVQELLEKLETLTARLEEKEPREGAPVIPEG